MKHYNLAEWQQYVQDGLDEEIRVQYENHLYQCDQCLELYVQAVETNEAEVNDISESDYFTDKIMEQIYDQSKQQPEEEKKRIQSHKQTFMHYAIAVAMTVLLMSTGVFSELMKMTDTVEKNETRHKESFVQNILDQQGSIINKFEMGAYIKEGKQNE